MRKFIFSAGIIFVFDQLSKWLAGRWGTLTINHGISFGVGERVPNLVVVVVLLLVLVGVMGELRTFWQRYPVLGGAFLGAVAGNVMDRLFLGGVRDWLPIPLTMLHNNLADWVICVVLVFVVTSEIFYRQKKTASS